MALLFGYLAEIALAAATMVVANATLEALTTDD